MLFQLLFELNSARNTAKYLVNPCVFNNCEHFREKNAANLAERGKNMAVTIMVTTFRAFTVSRERSRNARKQQIGPES